MNESIGATYDEIRRLSELIAATAVGERRTQLELQREELRAKARLLADATKSTAVLQAELANVEERLAAMSETEIKPAWVESHKLINDPSAYRRRINESIQQNQAADREQLERRRMELRAALDAPQSD